MPLRPWQVALCALLNIYPAYVARRFGAYLEAILLLVSAAALFYGHLFHESDVAVATADGGRSVSVVVVGLYLLGRSQWKHGTIITLLAACVGIGLAYGSLYVGRINPADNDDDVDDVDDDVDNVDDPLYSYAQQFRVLFSMAGALFAIAFACVVRLPSFLQRMSHDMIRPVDQLACFLVFLMLLASDLSTIFTAAILGPAAAVLVSHALFGFAASVAFYIRPREYSEVVRIDPSRVSRPSSTSDRSPNEV